MRNIQILGRLISSIQPKTIKIHKKLAKASYQKYDPNFPNDCWEQFGKIARAFFSGKKLMEFYGPKFR